MADTKITNLTEVTSPDAADVLAIVDDPAGTPVTKKIRYDNLVSTNSKTAAITAVFDGGGAAIEAAAQTWVRVPYDCTIQAVTMIADQSGSIVVDIWKDSYSSYPPTNSDSITASATPTISTALKSEDTSLTGWTTGISADDILLFNVDSVTDIQKLTLILDVIKD